MKKKEKHIPGAWLEPFLSSLGATEVAVVLVARTRNLFSCKEMLVQYKKEWKRNKKYQKRPHVARCRTYIAIKTVLIYTMFDGNKHRKNTVIHIEGAIEGGFHSSAT